MFLFLNTSSQSECLTRSTSKWHLNTGCKQMHIQLCFRISNYNAVRIFCLPLNRCHCVFIECSDETFLGRALEAVGLPVVFTRLGVAMAMVFVSFPFVVRTMQPVIQVSTTRICSWGQPAGMRMMFMRMHGACRMQTNRASPPAPMQALLADTLLSSKM